MYAVASDKGALSAPQPFLDRYREADGPALKTAIYLMSEGNSELSDIVRELDIPLETAERALKFWMASGLVRFCAEEPAPEPAAAPKEPRTLKTPKKDRPSLSPSQISNLMLCNPDIAVLMQETQNLLGRPLESSESRLLLEIFEFEELPVDVILMIVAYSLPRARHNRAVIAYASRIATQWREEGVTTAGAAEDRLRLLEQREERDRLVSETLGIDHALLTSVQKTQIHRWFEEYGYDIDVVREAYLRSGKGSVSYINSMIRSWKQSGYSTVREIRAIPSNAPAVPARSKKKNTSEKTLLQQAIDKRRARRTASHAT